MPGKKLKMEYAKKVLQAWQAKKLSCKEDDRIITDNDWISWMLESELNGTDDDQLFKHIPVQKIADRLNRVGNLFVTA